MWESEPREPIWSKDPTEEMINQDWLKMGPEKGKYTLVDARPSGGFLGGHIPTAVSLPYGAFQKQYASVLPEDKNRLLIFYCGGPT